MSVVISWVTPRNSSRILYIYVPGWPTGFFLTVFHVMLSFNHFFVWISRRIPPAGLEQIKNRTPSRVLEAGVPGAPSKANPWNPDVPRATYGFRWPPPV